MHWKLLFDGCLLGNRGDYAVRKRDGLHFAIYNHRGVGLALGASRHEHKARALCEGHRFKVRTGNTKRQIPAQVTVRLVPQGG